MNITLKETVTIKNMVLYFNYMVDDGIVILKEKRKKDFSKEKLTALKPIKAKSVKSNLRTFGVEKVLKRDIGSITKGIQNEMAKKLKLQEQDLNKRLEQELLKKDAVLKNKERELMLRISQKYEQREKSIVSQYSAREAQLRNLVVQRNKELSSLNEKYEVVKNSLNEVIKNLNKKLNDSELAYKKELADKESSFTNLKRSFDDERKNLVLEFSEKEKSLRLGLTKEVVQREKNVLQREKNLENELKKKEAILGKQLTKEVAQRENKVAENEFSLKQRIGAANKEFSLRNSELDSLYKEKNKRLDDDFKKKVEVLRKQLTKEVAQREVKLKSGTENFNKKVKEESEKLNEGHKKLKLVEVDILDKKKILSEKMQDYLTVDNLIFDFGKKINDRVHTLRLLNHSKVRAKPKKKIVKNSKNNTRQNNEEAVPKPPKKDVTEKIKSLFR